MLTDGPDIGQRPNMDCLVCQGPDRLMIRPCQDQGTAAQGEAAGGASGKGADVVLTLMNHDGRNSTVSHVDGRISYPNPCLEWTQASSQFKTRADNGKANVTNKLYPSGTLT